MLCLFGTSHVRLFIQSSPSHRRIAAARNGKHLPGIGYRKLCRITAAAGLWALSLGPAHAYLVYDTSTVAFSNTASVTDTEDAGSTSEYNADLGTSELEQFDATLGVLTGVTINLDSTRSQTVTVSATDGNNSGNNNSRTSTGTGISTVGISAPGITYTSSAITADGFCTGLRQEACTNTITAAPVPTIHSQTATSDSLDSYVGGETVTVSRTAPTLSAEQLNRVFTGTETTQYELTWAGDLSATYSYLLHAAPSFDGSASIDSLVLDFGTVAQNSSVSPLGFSIFNLAAADRTALDLIGFIATGDYGVLDSGLSAFANLEQGFGQQFQATLDTTSLGDFSATYTLTLSDAVSTGAASSRHTYTLNLTLKGNVTAVAAVPVPDAFWLFGTGLLGVVGIARRGTS